MAYNPYWDYAVFATHLDGAEGSSTFTELTGKTIISSGASLSSAQSKFGGTSAHVPAGYIGADAHADFSFSGEFCVAFHVYTPSSGYGSGVFSQRLGGTYCPIVLKYGASSEGKVAASFLVANAAVNGWAHIGEPFGGNAKFDLGAWNYVEISGNGTTISFRVNDVVGSSTIAHPAWPNTPQPIYFGRDADGGSSSYFDDVAVYKKYFISASVPTDAFGDQPTPLAKIAGDVGGIQASISASHFGPNVGQIAATVGVLSSIFGEWTLPVVRGSVAAEIQVSVKIIGGDDVGAFLSARISSIGSALIRVAVGRAGEIRASVSARALIAGRHGRKVRVAAAASFATARLVGRSGVSASVKSTIKVVSKINFGGSDLVR